MGRINKEMVGSEEVITKDRESNSCKDKGKERRERRERRESKE